MRNFCVIGECDVEPLVKQLEQREDLWNENPERLIGFNMKEAADFDDIWVHLPDSASKLNREELQRRIETLPYANRWHRSYFEVPAIKPIVMSVFMKHDGELFGRVFISRLKPGKSIFPHADVDLGPYCRFHVALQSAEGQEFWCDGETFTPQPGQVFWFDNSIEHAVYNKSNSDRLTMVIDIMTPWKEYFFNRHFNQEQT